MKKKFPKNEFQSKIEYVLDRIHDDLFPLTPSDEHREKVKRLVADAIEMEFEDWDTQIKSCEYDPQVE